MGVLFEGVNWLAVGVSTIICFMLGALWYSPMMFGTKWAEGVKVDIGPEARQPVAALVTQFIGTLLLAWLIGLTYFFGVYSLDGADRRHHLLFTGGGKFVRRAQPLCHAD